MDTPPYSLDDLLWFIRIAEAGSLSAAARQLDVPKSTLSRRLARMETAGGVGLVKRNTRAFQLTQAGRHLFEEAAPLVRRLDIVTGELLARETTPRGLVRVSASGSFGKLVLLPLITDYLLAHPEVSIEMELTDRRINVIEQGVDFAVRIGELADSGLKARKLGVVRRVLCASAAYVRQNGLPQSPEELVAHRCLLQSRTSATMELKQGSRAVAVTLQGRLVLGPSDAMLAPVQRGLGIAALPEVQVAAQLNCGALVRVLPDWQLPTLTAYLLFPAQRYQSPAARDVMEFLHGSVPARIQALARGDDVDA